MPRDPLTFEPLFMERVWGGRRLADRFDKPLPADEVIGESWELVDREEAQSVVTAGEFAGVTLGELWRSDRREALFGPQATWAGSRFPLLIKLLDCEQTLSVQVHPPADVATRLGGEPKTEMWIVLDATDGAHLFTGLRRGVSREDFEVALTHGRDVSEMLFRHDVGVGDVMFLPSGRVHAIGAGNVILEVQQNSDTTYRVFDFNRAGLDGKPRQLHIEESLQSIDWSDVEPPLVASDQERLVHNEVFEVDRLVVPGGSTRSAAAEGRCAILVPIDGRVRCAGRTFAPGQLFLIRADAEERALAAEGTGPVTLIRTLLPG